MGRAQLESFYASWSVFTDCCAEETHPWGFPALRTNEVRTCGSLRWAHRHAQLHPSGCCNWNWLLVHNQCKQTQLHGSWWPELALWIMDNQWRFVSLTSLYDIYIFMLLLYLIFAVFGVIGRRSIVRGNKSLLWIYCFQINFSGCGKSPPAPHEQQISFCIFSGVAFVFYFFIFLLFNISYHILGSPGV